MNFEIEKNDVEHSLWIGVHSRTIAIPLEINWFVGRGNAYISIVFLCFGISYEYWNYKILKEVHDA